MKGIKRIICAAGAAAVFLFSPYSSAFAEEAVPDFNVAVHAPPQVLFIGDSVISGYGLDGYSPDNKLVCDSFANILSREFESELPAQAEFRYYNEGLDGRTSGELLELLRSGAIDDELKDTDAMIVSIGGNDMLMIFLGIFFGNNTTMEKARKILSLDSDFDKALDGFEVNMPLIAEEFHKRSDGQLFVQTLFNPTEATSMPLINKFTDEKIGRLNSIIYANSQNGSNYKVVDVYSELKGKSHELTNIDKKDIHPNAEGHKTIAALLDKAIRAETYHYYDYEAEQRYKEKLEQDRLKAIELQKEQEEAEIARKEKNKKVGAAAAAGSAAAIAGGVLLIRRGKRRNG